MMKRGLEPKWLVLSAVATGIFLATIDGSIVNIALPIFERELNASFSAVQWVVLAYLLTITTLLLSVGRLADMTGKKKLYLSGFVIFIVGSALCGLANRIEMLIAFRVLQAVGGAMITALGAAIVTEAFPPSERGKALGINGLMVSIGLISGPTIGGLILSAASWHWIFFVNVPVGLAGVLLGMRFIPAIAAPGGQKFDFWGAGTLFVSLFSLLLGITLGQDLGFTAPLILAMFVVFIVGLIAFIWIENHIQQPMIDLSLFKNKLFSVNLITGYLVFLSGSGSVLLMPFFLQNVLKYDPRTAGLLLASVPVAMGLVAPVAGALSDRWGSRRLTVLGLCILWVGYLLVLSLDQNVSAWGYVLRFLPVGIGTGLFQSPNNSAIMGTAPRNRLGVASGLLSLTRTVGQTMGIAILGAVWTSRQLLLQAAQSGLSEAELQVAALHDTVLLIISLISVAVMLSIWALWKERAALNDDVEAALASAKNPRSF